MKYTRKNLSDMILFGMHAATCMQISTDQEKKKHTEFVLQYSVFNFLTVFDIKMTKSPRIPNLKRKVDISSNFNGLFHQFKLELFIDIIFMENTEMWNKCP